MTALKFLTGIAFLVLSFYTILQVGRAGMRKIDEEEERDGF